MVYSLRIGTKKKLNFKKILNVEPTSNKIGQNCGTSLVIGLNLWTLHNPYMIPGLLPHSFKTYVFWSFCRKSLFIFCFRLLFLDY